MKHPRAMTVREALISMCYREVRPGVWGKPIGYQLFSFSEEHAVWENWFLQAGGKLALWESHKFVEGYDYLSSLKTWEAYTRIHGTDGVSAFEFSAIDI